MLGMVKGILLQLNVGINNELALSSLVHSTLPKVKNFDSFKIVLQI